MPTGLIRILTVAHCVLILLSFSAFIAADEADRAALVVLLMPWCDALVWGGGHLVKKLGRQATLLIYPLMAFPALYRRPQLILTPEGVVVRRLRRTTRGGWDAVPTRRSVRGWRVPKACPG